MEAKDRSRIPLVLYLLVKELCTIGKRSSVLSEEISSVPVRKFNIITDHKPLTAILGPKKGIPSLAAARLRWAILLSAYNYDIVFKPTQADYNTDGLLRLPLPEATQICKDMFNVAQIHALPIIFQTIKTATSHDPVLSKVFTYVRNGWPATVPEQLKPYKTRENEIGVES